MTAVSGPTWTDIVGAVGGIAGIGIGGLSAVIAGLAKKHARESAEEAKEVRRIEADRQHDLLRPDAPAEISTESRTSTLFGSITIPSRDYRVAAAGVYETDARYEIFMPPILRANRAEEFAIQPGTREIRFRFWPPDDGDDAAGWTCRCGRTSSADTTGDGHWEFVIRVAEPPVEPWVSMQ